MISPHPLDRRDMVSLALILVVAAVMRMGDLGNMTYFLYDQGSQSLLALDMLTGKSVPTLGPESTSGVHHSPLTVYFLLLPYALSSSPLFVNLFIAAFNVLGVGLLWLLTRRYFGGPTVAMIAGLAQALNPWAIGYSRVIWVPNFLTPFVVSGVLLGLYGFVEGKRWAQVFCLPVLIIGLQMHFAGWLLMPVFAWLVWLGRKRIFWFGLGASVVLAFLVTVPYLIGLTTQETAAATGRFEAMKSIIQSGPRLRQETVDHFVNIATGIGSAAGGDTDVGRAILQKAMPEPRTLWRVIGVVMAVGFIGVWVRRSQWRLAVLLTLWIVALFAFFIPNWTGTGIYPHHFIPLIPALCILAGIGLDFIRRHLSKRPVVQWAVVSAFAVLMLSWGWWTYRWWRLWDTRYLYVRVPLPIHYLLDVRAELEPFDDVLIVGGNSNTSGYVVWKPLLYYTASCVREVMINTGGLAVYPDGPFAVIAPPSAPSSVWLDEIYSTSDSTSVPLIPGQGSYSIRFFEEGLAWSGPPLIEVGPVRFANGVQWIGYQLGDGVVYFAWRLPEARDTGYLRSLGHLLNSDGERIGYADLDFWAGQYWCEGDTVVSWFETPIPEQTEILRVGLYVIHDDGSQTYVDVVDEQGRIVSPWVDIRLDE